MTAPTYNPFVERLSREELEAYQLAKLRGQLLYVRSSSPFYRQKLGLDERDVERLTLKGFGEVVPVTRKAELVEDQAERPPFGTRLAVDPRQVAQVTTTGGTSGGGQEIQALTVADVASTASLLTWGLHWGGLGAGDAVLNTLPISLGAAGQWLARALAQLRCLELQVGVYSTEQKLDLAVRFGAKAVIATPSYLMTLAHAAQARGLDLAGTPIARLCTATEAFSVEWAHGVEQTWGATLSEWYGSSQRAIAWTCELGAAPGERHGVLHTFPHMSVIEVLDPESGEHVEPGGEGEVVVTFLESEASPLIRFATGDRARYLGWDSCECGRSFPGLESGTISRYDDMLKVKGVSFWPAAVDALVFSQPIGKRPFRDYRGRVYSDDRGRERIEVTVGFEEHVDPAGRRALLDELAERIRAQIGLAMEVAAGDVAEDAFRDERTKARRWRDERIH
jgi:phenylacetate-CoA ligase